MTFFSLFFPAAFFFFQFDPVLPSFGLGPLCLSKSFFPFTLRPFVFSLFPSRPWSLVIEELFYPSHFSCAAFSFSDFISSSLPEWEKYRAYPLYSSWSSLGYLAHTWFFLPSFNLQVFWARRGHILPTFFATFFLRWFFPLFPSAPNLLIQISFLLLRIRHSSSPPLPPFTSTPPQPTRNSFSPERCFLLWRILLSLFFLNYVFVSFPSILHRRQVHQSCLTDWALHFLEPLPLFPRPPESPFCFLSIILVGGITLSEV